MPKSMRGGIVTGAILATVVITSACSIGAPDATTGGTSTTGVDSIAADTQYTGTLETDPQGDFAFVGSAEVAVGDLDAGLAGETQRGVLTFDVSRYASSTTIKAATLRVDECAVFGDPFATLGEIVLDHISALAPPTQSVYSGSTLTSNIGTIAPDATIGFRYMTVTTAVQTDVTGGKGLSAFRLRFSVEDGNNNGVSDYVDIRAVESGDCDSDATRAPLLIVTS